MTLEEAGVTSGFVSFNEARRTWGEAFIAGVASGEIRPISKGKSEHAKKAYRKGDILAYIANQTEKARVFFTANK